MRAHSVNTLRSEHGAASILMLAIIGSVVTVLALLITGGTVLLAFLSVQSAASDAALSATEMTIGERAGYPCAHVRDRASDAGATMTQCLVRGHHVRLIWSMSLLGMSVPIRAQAGAH